MDTPKSIFLYKSTFITGIFLLLGKYDWRCNFAKPKPIEPKVTKSRKKKYAQMLCMGFLLSLGCVDPIEPEFDFKSGVIFVEGLISNDPKTSVVRVSQNSMSGNAFISNATVSVRNTDTNSVTGLFEDNGRYLLPEDFTAAVGDIFELTVTLPDGRQYQSLPEEIRDSVPILDIEARYNPELVFREASESFVPGHTLHVSFEDPEEGNNYYFWRFTSFENLSFCQRCFDGIFRNGACQNNSLSESQIRKSFYTYRCETPCWRIRFNETVETFADEFSNGSLIEQLPVGNVLLYTKEDILVQLQQYALSESAYRYYQVFKDIVDNNGGFNAPPPAALIGNMFAVHDENEFVIGRFTATSVVSRYLFIDRTTISESQIEERIVVQNEEFGEVPQPTRNTAPCEELPNRTGVRPTGWINN